MDNDTLSKGSSSMVGAAIVAILAVVFVALRFYARRHYKSGIAWDDWWILIGLVITLLEGALLLASTLAHISNNQGFQLTASRRQHKCKGKRCHRCRQRQ
jgi:ABC-type amino acid transport system permease subunit